MDTITAKVDDHDRMHFPSGRGTQIVVEAGQAFVNGAEGKTDDAYGPHTIELMVGPLCSEIHAVVPHATASGWRHLNSDEDDNQAWQVMHPRWEVHKGTGGEQVVLKIDVLVMGQHAEVRSISYHVTIEADEVSR